jgi:hypothetical protein
MGKVVGPLSRDNCGAKIACEIASNFVLGNSDYLEYFIISIYPISKKRRQFWVAYPRA